MVERPQGVRSNLRNSLAETADASNDVVETVLPHSVGGKVNHSYRRTDFLEQRQVLMQRWADHVIGKSGAVVQNPTRGSGK